MGYILNLTGTTALGGLKMNNSPKSPYQGIIWSQSHKCWQIQFNINKKCIWGGYYKDIEDAKYKLDKLVKLHNKTFRKPRTSGIKLEPLPKKEKKPKERLFYKGEDAWSPYWLPEPPAPVLDIEVAKVFIESFVQKVGWETEVTTLNLTATINFWAERHGVGAVNEDMVAKVLQNNFGKWVGLRLLS